MRRAENKAGARGPGTPHDATHANATGTRCMNQRLLLATGAIAAILLMVGLLGADYPLARAVHESGFEKAMMFEGGLHALDIVVGIHVWYWLAACLFIGFGLLGMLLAPRLRLPPRLAPALFAAGLVQAATIGLMILGKGHFGRLRPYQVFASGDWSNVWFAGGSSFPSGHSAFYFGLFLPLAAAAPMIWQRVVLLALPAFVVIARIDLAMHFLADVSASALIAASVALIVSLGMRRWQRVSM